MQKGPKDLSAIATRATEPSPENRYASVREFADDLRRFETGQLVMAQKYSRFSLVLRWVKAHKGAIATTALVAALVVGSVVSGSLIAESARQEEAAKQEKLAEKLEAQRQEEKKLDRKPEYRLMDTFVGLMDGTTKAKELKSNRTSLSRNEKLLEENPYDILQQRELANSYEQVGISLLDVLIGEGDSAGAHKEFQKALAIRQRLAKENPDRTSLQELSVIQLRIGELFYQQYQLESSVRYYRKAMETSAKNLTLDSNSTVNRRFVDIRNILARVLSESGDVRASLALFQAGLATEIRILEENSDDPKRKWRASIAFGRIADLFLLMKKPEAAFKHYKSAIALAESDGYRDPKWKRATAIHYLRLGRLLRQKGEENAAIAAFSNCEELYDDFGYSTNDHYDSACCAALAGHKDKAFEAIEFVVDRNWNNPLSFESQLDFTSLRSDRRWHWLLARLLEKRDQD